MYFYFIIFLYIFHMIFLDHSLLFLFFHIFFYFFLIFLYIFNIYYIIFLLSYLDFCDFCILSDMICCILFKRSFLIYTFVCTKVKKSLQNIILQRLFLFFYANFFILIFYQKIFNFYSIYSTSYSAIHS